jgi:hypothetical protein
MHTYVTCIPNKTIPKICVSSSNHNSNAPPVLPIQSQRHPVTTCPQKTDPPTIPSNRPIPRRRRSSSSGRRGRRTPQRQQRKQPPDNRSIAKSNTRITITETKRQRKSSHPTTTQRKAALGLGIWGSSSFKNLLPSNSIVQIGESEVGGRAAEPGRDGRDEAVAEGGVGGCGYVEFPVVCGEVVKVLAGDFTGWWGRK